MSQPDPKRQSESVGSMRYRTQNIAGTTSQGTKGFQPESPTSIEDIPDVYFPATIPTPAAFRDSPPPRPLLRQNSSTFPLNRETNSRGGCVRELGERQISASSLHDLTRVPFDDRQITVPLPCYATLSRKRAAD